MRVPVIGLLGRTGERRELARDCDPAEFGDEPWGGAVDGVEGPIALDLVLEAVSDGVLVRGGLDAVLRIPCARCLAATLHPRRVEVTELHHRADRATEDADDGEEYVLVDGDTALDLDRTVRDALVLDVPVRVLCRPDCAGLCPVCGADRNTEPCDHGVAPDRDPRWAVLDDLRDRLTGGDGPGGAG